jgi:hypothetical protein
MKRTPLARIPLDRDELVVSLDDRLDIRIWKPTGYASMPTAAGVTMRLHLLPDLIEALQRARRRAA